MFLVYFCQEKRPLSAEKSGQLQDLNDLSSHSCHVALISLDHFQCLLLAICVVVLCRFLPAKILRDLGLLNAKTNNWGQQVGYQISLLVSCLISLHRLPFSCCTSTNDIIFCCCFTSLSALRGTEIGTLLWRKWSKVLQVLVIGTEANIHYAISVTQTVKSGVSVQLSAEMGTAPKQLSCCSTCPLPLPEVRYQSPHTAWWLLVWTTAHKGKAVKPIVTCDLETEF